MPANFVPIFICLVSLQQEVYLRGPQSETAYSCIYPTSQGMFQDQTANHNITYGSLPPATYKGIDTYRTTTDKIFLFITSIRLILNLHNCNSWGAILRQTFYYALSVKGTY